MTLDPLTHAFVVGFFACMMTVFPVALLLLIPHDGWGSHLPSNYTKKLQREIVDLKKKIDQLEGQAILDKQV